MKHLILIRNLGIILMSFNMVNDTKNIYIFGYGSLMFPAGVNGRGMNYQYTKNDLNLATLSGWRRGWYARWNKDLYYGILSDKTASVNGVVFKIHSMDDLKALNLSELCDPSGYPLNTQPYTYTLTDVTDSISYQNKSDNDVIYS